MADLAAKREARRRKITQNAEARMNKLLGIDTSMSIEHTTTNTTDGSGDTEALVQQDESPTQLGTHDVKAREESSSPYNLRQRPNRRSSPISSSNYVEEQTSNNNALITGSTDPGPSEAQISNNENTRTVPEERQTSGTTVTESTENVSSLKLKVQTDGNTLEAIHMAGCIISALIARYVLSFGVGIFYLQTILLPFIAFQVLLSYLTQTHLKHLSRHPPRGTMWSAALMLCGIKQELINQYNIIMSRVSLAFSDLCLYLFAFIVWHVVMGG